LDFCQIRDLVRFRSKVRCKRVCLQTPANKLNHVGYRFADKPTCIPTKRVHNTIRLAVSHCRGLMPSTRHSKYLGLFGWCPENCPNLDRWDYCLVWWFFWGPNQTSPCCVFGADRPSSCLGDGPCLEIVLVPINHLCSVFGRSQRSAVR